LTLLLTVQEVKNRGKEQIARNQDRMPGGFGKDTMNRE